MNKKSSICSTVLSLIALVISIYVLLKTFPTDESYKEVENHIDSVTEEYDMTREEIETLVKDNVEIINARVEDGKLTELLQIEGIDSIIVRDHKIAFYCGKAKVGNKDGFNGFYYKLKESDETSMEDTSKVSITKTDGENEISGALFTIDGKTYQGEVPYSSEKIIEKLYYFESQIYGL